MDSVVNEPFLKQRSLYARWGSYIGFGFLFAGLISMNRSYLLAYLFMLVGLIGAAFGSYIANRYVREPRPDQAFGEALEGLDKRYKMYSYYPPSNHLIASHYGLTILEPRTQEGEIAYDGGRWRHKAGWRKVFQLFGEPAIGKPDQDVTREVEWVKEWIDQVLPEDDIRVTGAVVLTGSKVTLDASDSPVPAVKQEDLTRHLKEGLKGKQTLTTAKQKELRSIMDQVVAEIDADSEARANRTFVDHLRGIPAGILRAIRRE